MKAIIKKGFAFVQLSKAQILQLRNILGCQNRPLKFKSGSEAYVRRGGIAVYPDRKIPKYAELLGICIDPVQTIKEALRQIRVSLVQRPVERARLAKRYVVRYVGKYHRPEVVSRTIQAESNKDSEILKELKDRLSELPASLDRLRSLQQHFSH